jgi:superfamily II DNA/RNA helicase
MRDIDFKNRTVDLDSKKVTWEEMKTPETIIKGLNKMSYRKPSIIQGLSIPMVVSD